MPSSSDVTSAALDLTGVRLIPYFDSADENGATVKSTWPKCEAEEVMLRAGKEPSTALVRVPLRALDERAPAVAGIQGGPLHGLRVGTRAEVHAIMPDATSWVLLRGSVVNVSHAFGERSDLGQVKLADDRWLLQGLPIAGSWWSESNGTYAYRQGWPAHVNKAGLPNAVFNGAAGCHMFCEPLMGIESTIPSGSDLDTTRACYWEPWMWFAYLHFAFGATAVAAARAYHAWYPSPPAELAWPNGLGNALYRYPSEGENRKCPERNHDGMNVLDSMIETLKADGRWDLYVEPAVWGGTLQLVRAKYESSAAVPIIRSRSASDLGNPQIVIAGDLQEDGGDLYTQLVAVGALTFIERRVSETGTGLVQAWSSADESAVFGSGVGSIHDWLTSGSGAQGREVAEAVERAFKAYPDICAAWKVSPTYDFQTGTAEDLMPRANVNRPVLPQLLSSYLEDSTATAVRGRNQYRRPVLFSSIVSGGSWRVCSWGDGFTIGEDGKIWLPGLREKVVDGATTATYQTDAFLLTTSGASGTSGLKGYSIASLRATLAIPCDHRLTVARRSPVAEGDVGLPCLPENGDEDRIESGLARQAYVRAGKEVDEGGGLYGRELRRDAYPVPQEVAGAAQESVLRDDTGQLLAHVEERATEYTRLRRGGTLVIPHLALAWTVGQCLSELQWIGGAYPLRAAVHQVALRNGYSEGGRSQRAVLSLR